MEPAAADTADLLLFMVKLFDSVNGSSVVPQNGKILQCAMTCKSGHIKFWNDPIKVLTTMRYICPKTKAMSSVPSIRNWILTLQGFKYLTNKLLGEGLEFISMRNFNQDPVENFFCCIRSHGVRNVNPSCTAFISTFKALLITNFMSSHSVGSNCEDDDSFGALNTLKSFVTDNIRLESHPSSSSQSHRNICGQQSTIGLAATVYTGGFVAKRIFAYTKKCQRCEEELMSPTVLLEHEIIKMRAYSPRALFYPHTRFNAILSRFDINIHFGSGKN